MSPPGRDIGQDLDTLPLSRLWSLEGRVAVVTGGAAGIGQATGMRLAEAGALVVIADRDLEQARATAGQLDGGHLGVYVDVAEPESIVELGTHVMDEFGRIDIWVNNAGIYPLNAALDINLDEWSRVIAVNLTGTFLGCQEAARHIISRGEGGVIINVASVSGHRPSGPAHYTASKYGVRGITERFARELGPDSIRVVAIAPTAVATPGVAEATRQGAASGFDSSQQRTQRLPLGRIGVPDDIARVIAFVASDMAALMTGSTLVVDAGDLVS